MRHGSKLHVRDQHMTSVLVLSRFAAPFSRASGELRLEEVDFAYPERPRRHRAPSKCAYVRDFITFDSAAAERVWGVQRALPGWR
jgi:hypothetical protein